MHLIVTDKKCVIKVLYSFRSKAQILEIIDLFRLSQPKHSVALTTMPHIKHHPYTYRYEYMPHAGLVWKEAKCCLRELVLGIYDALCEIHGLGFKHNDLRLDNICFANDCMPVLIDFDRSTRLEDNAYFDINDLSCMYNLEEPPFNPNGNTDFLQLGWLTAWVLDSEHSDYHERKWGTQREIVTENKFVQQLILQGEFDEALLGLLPEDTHPLISVLKKRNSD